jgi:hypothetical protein
MGEKPIAQAYAIVYDLTQIKARFMCDSDVSVRGLLLFEGVVGRTYERA